jgi:hypothetical protein
MEGFREENETMARGSSEESQENKNNWVKKMVLECIVELKEDIKEADLLTSDILKGKLERVAPKGQ